jgi:signal transduction histidine kinase
MRTGDTLTGILVIARDVTERKAMQKKLEEYSQQLEALVEQRTRQLKEAQDQLIKSERLAAIGQVAAMVGHDLRNPLTGINSAAYYLKTRLGSTMNKKTMEMLELIEKDVQYSNKIITDLLEYSREIKLEFGETTPKSIIREASSLVEIPVNIHILDLTQDEPRIKIDLEKMKRVFSNLIKNAIEAMSDGGKLTIISRKSDENVEFAFADTGTGIPKDVMEKIWTPFFTTKSKGMGLGLPICKRIVEAHGGIISVESKIGEGTVFTVTIPIEPKKEVREHG